MRTSSGILTVLLLFQPACIVGSGETSSGSSTAVEPSTAETGQGSAPDESHDNSRADVDGGTRVKTRIRPTLRGECPDPTVGCTSSNHSIRVKTEVRAGAIVGNHALPSAPDRWVPRVPDCGQAVSRTLGDVAVERAVPTAPGCGHPLPQGPAPSQMQ
jgi:hypothetical protein